MLQSRAPPRVPQDRTGTQDGGTSQALQGTLAPDFLNHTRWLLATGLEQSQRRGCTSTLSVPSPAAYKADTAPSSRPALPPPSGPNAGLVPRGTAVPRCLCATAPPGPPDSEQGGSAGGLRDKSCSHPNSAEAWRTNGSQNRGAQPGGEKKTPPSLSKESSGAPRDWGYQPRDSAGTQRRQGSCSHWRQPPGSIATGQRSRCIPGRSTPAGPLNPRLSSS